MDDGPFFTRIKPLHYTLFSAHQGLSIKVLIKAWSHALTIGAKASLVLMLVLKGSLGTFSLQGFSLLAAGRFGGLMFEVGEEPAEPAIFSPSGVTLKGTHIWEMVHMIALHTC